MPGSWLGEDYPVAGFLAPVLAGPGAALPGRSRAGGRLTFSYVPVYVRGWRKA